MRCASPLWPLAAGRLSRLGFHKAIMPRSTETRGGGRTSRAGHGGLAMPSAARGDGSAARSSRRPAQGGVARIASGITVGARSEDRLAVERGDRAR
jgi:hypothetical protein